MIMLGDEGEEQSSPPAPESDAELLQAIGDALFGVAGPWWHASFAELLGVSSRTIRRWVSGERRPPAEVWGRLAELVQQRAQELAALAACAREMTE